MKNVKIINYMKRSSWVFSCSIAPFGNSQHFLYENQIKPVGRKSVEPLENNYHTITFNYFHCLTSRENFVLNPKKSYSDLIGELFDESLVARNLEKMFDVDNLGSSLNEDKTFSDYDKAKMKEFENSIHYKNNVYYVDLPWHENRIKTVPSNYPVALRILEKTNNHIESKKPSWLLSLKSPV